MKYKVGDIVCYRPLNSNGKVLKLYDQMFSVQFECDMTSTRWLYNEKNISLVTKRKQLKLKLP